MVTRLELIRLASDGSRQIQRKNACGTLCRLRVIFVFRVVMRYRQLQIIFRGLVPT